MLRSALACLAVVALSSPGLAQSCVGPDPALGFSAFDRARLENLEASRDKGLAAAGVHDLSEEGNTIAALFAEGLEPPDPATLPGAYRCRTIKLGGISPRVIYSWFRCEISVAEGGFTLTKVTGSQNFTGLLAPVEDGYVFRGAGNYGDEPPRAYGEEAERDLAGCLTQVYGDPRHLVLDLPEPRLESFHDVIELVPAT